MELGARPAVVASDLDVLAALARAAIDELRPLRGGALWAELDARTEPIDDGFAAEIAAHASTASSSCSPTPTPRASGMT